MAKIEVFTGPMCSGKSAALLNKIKRYEIAGKEVLLIKPKRDTRDGNAVVSRDGGTYVSSENTYQLESLDDIDEVYLEHNKKTHPKTIDLIAIDEFHFFENCDEFIFMIMSFAVAGIDIAISGLDLSHNGRPFEMMGRVMCVADKIHKFTAICSVTKEDRATITLMNISTNDDKVVGGDDIYQPVSREVWFKNYIKKIKGI